MLLSYRSLCILSADILQTISKTGLCHFWIIFQL